MLASSCGLGWSPAPASVGFLEGWSDSPEHSLLPSRWQPAGIPTDCRIIQTTSLPQWGISETPHLHLLSCTLERKTPALFQGWEGLLWLRSRAAITPHVDTQTRAGLRLQPQPACQGAAPHSWGLLPAFPLQATAFQPFPPIYPFLNFRQFADILHLLWFPFLVFVLIDLNLKRKTILSLLFWWRS